MINYDNIHKSIEFYEKRRYIRVESPWTVTESISSLTRPVGSKDFTILEKNKVLVASGEQSFLYLYVKGFLPKGRFQTVTPCFRDEVFDTTHSKYFIKNELIVTDEVHIGVLMEMVIQSKVFFKSILGNKFKVEDIRTGDNSFDIVVKINNKEYELGSYGIRHCEFLSWVYGTGCAEPRLSFVKSLVKE